MASDAPLRISFPARFTPLMRVCALKDKSASQVGEVAFSQVELLLGQDYYTASLRSFISQGGQLSYIGQPVRQDALAGMNSTAMRLPRVIVPVLSRSNTSTSPAASTALPDMASMLRFSTVHSGNSDSA